MTADQLDGIGHDARAAPAAALGRNDLDRAEHGTPSTPQGRQSYLSSPGDCELIIRTEAHEVPSNHILECLELRIILGSTGIRSVLIAWPTTSRKPLAYRSALCRLPPT